jgi:hypothetical protein
MSEQPNSDELLAELREHPELEALKNLVRAAALDAAAARRADFASRFNTGSSPTTGQSHVPEGLTHEKAETPHGNVLELLEHGAEKPEERRLLGALLALAIADHPPESPEAEEGLAGHLVWLAAHTKVDALKLIDAVLDERAEGIWRGVARVAEAPSDVASDFGATEALVAAAALGESPASAARALRYETAPAVVDPAVRALLNRSSLSDEDDALAGELSPAPYGTIVTTLLTVTLLMFLASLVRSLARLTLAYKRPAELRITERGLELRYRTELMGKVLRERSTVVPMSNLARVTREVKYARLGLYAGLLALVIGTYFGMGLFIDGIRVPGGSASLLGMAALLMVIGLFADFLLSGASDNVRGKCRLVVVPRKGKRLCVGALDPRRADAMLANIAAQSSAA